MPEWLNGTVSKTVLRATVTRVRIPLSPLIVKICWLLFFYSFSSSTHQLEHCRHCLYALVLAILLSSTTTLKELLEQTLNRFGL